MVNLPTKWVDLSHPKKRVYDLTEKDMPVPANLMAHHDLGLCMILVSSEEVWHGSSQIPEKARDTRVSVEFKAGFLMVHNKRLLKLIMSSIAWNDLVGIDPEDSTGFWVQAGFIKPRTIKVVITDDIKRGNFGEIDFGKIKEPKEKVASLLQVSKGEVSTQIEVEPHGVEA